jgi:hypothetical protein
MRFCRLLALCVFLAFLKPASSLSGCDVTDTSFYTCWRECGWTHLETLVSVY